LLLLSKDFLSGHFKKFEISFRALKPRPACVPLNLRPETPKPFASRQPRDSAVSDRAYSRRSGRGQWQRQCCDCQQQENEGETERIISRAQVGDDGASEEQDETDCDGCLIVPISGGTFAGPRLKGTIILPSGDWVAQRPDGSRVLDVRILLQTDDGTKDLHIMARNRL
jgi:hypothetical protein